MGQDDSCGICGRDYDRCRHYRKEHVYKDGQDLHNLPLTLCGRNVEDVAAVSVSKYLKVDNNPDDLCISCEKLAKTRLNICLVEK